MAARVIEAQRSRPREVESDARQHVELGAALRAIVPALDPEKRRHALDPRMALLIRIELHLFVLPSAGNADAIQKRGVHLETGIVMLQLDGNIEPMRIVGVRALRGGPLRRFAAERARLGKQVPAVPLQMRTLSHRHIAADDAVVLRAELAVGDERARILTLAEVHHFARDVEDVLSAAGRRRVGRRQEGE